MVLTGLGRWSLCPRAPCRLRKRPLSASWPPWARPGSPDDMPQTPMWSRSGRSARHRGTKYDFLFQPWHGYWIMLTSSYTGTETHLHPLQKELGHRVDVPSWGSKRTTYFAGHDLFFRALLRGDLCIWDYQQDDRQNNLIYLKNRHHRFRESDVLIETHDDDVLRLPIY